MALMVVDLWQKNLIPTVLYMPKYGLKCKDSVCVSSQLACFSAVPSNTENFSYTRLYTFSILATV